MIRWLWIKIVIITLFAALPCYSQNNEIFAPFVTQLTAEIRNNLIRLSWIDSSDIKGPVYLYRSETPLSDVSGLSPFVEIPYGTESYLDEAEKPGNLYYYIAASDESNKKYSITIPFTNMASVTVKPENVAFSSPNIAGKNGSTPTPSPSLISTLPPLSNPSSTVRPGVQGIDAKIDGDRIIITFAGADKERNPILYRSIHPIRRPDDLVTALVIRQRVISPFVDRPLPGVTYYYAVVYEEELTAGVIEIRQGINVTSAVEIPATRQITSRNVPLPGIALSTSPGLNQLFVNPDTAGTENNQQQDSIGSRPSAYIFSEDLAAGGTEEEYQLRSIVQNYFVVRNWEETQAELKHFLEIPRKKQTRAKAHFYLGQTYFFQDKQRDALFHFLEAQESYPIDANLWIQTVLKRLINGR